MRRNSNLSQFGFLQEDCGALATPRYKDAELREFNSGWVIEYYCTNELDKYVRARIKVQHIRRQYGEKLARKHIAQLMANLNTALCENNGRMPQKGGCGCSLMKCIDLFMKEKVVDFDNDSFREDSMRTYRSQTDMFVDWLRQRKLVQVSPKGLTRHLAQEYLDYVYLQKRVSARTYNNYLGFMRTVFAWIVKKEYCDNNPFSQLTPKRVSEKNRTVIPREWTVRIIEYCRAHDPNLELVCELVYNSFMRPAEVCRTRIRDLDLDNGAIHLEGSATKNGKSRWCLLPPHLVERLKASNITAFAPDWYLVSSGLAPGAKLINTRDINRAWDRMRKKIGLSMQYKLYSFRDTGITDMKAVGVSDLFLSSVTGHSNPDELQTYTHRPQKAALDFVREHSKPLL